MIRLEQRTYLDPLKRVSEQLRSVEVTAAVAVDAADAAAAERATVADKSKHPCREDQPSRKEERRARNRILVTLEDTKVQRPRARKQQLPGWLILTMKQLKN